MRIVIDIKQIVTIVLFVTLFVGCSTKEAVSEYDKPALYWYKHIVKEVASNNLDKADNYYISLRSEHMRSPVLPTATMFLAQAHMDEQEFIMADYYLDEYLKKYAGGSRVEQAKFLKIKAAFLGIKDINKEQKLMLDTLKNVDSFVEKYPTSIYKPIVQTIRVRLNMAQYMLNENIANLYARIGKDEASKIYRDKNRNSPLHMADIKAPEVGVLGSVFN